MIMKIDNLTPGKFHLTFPVIRPCDCEMEEKGTRYNVRVIGNDKTLLVTHVFIKCNICNASKNFDVASDKRLFSELRFKV